jgi:hypothetical protein
MIGCVKHTNTQPEAYVSNLPWRAPWALKYSFLGHGPAGNSSGSQAKIEQHMSGDDEAQVLSLDASNWLEATPLV